MTFRKSGEGVATPVWFAKDAGELLVYSLAEAGKVKRIRNNPNVKVAPCDVRGRVHGEWLAGTARILEGAEAHRANDLLGQKYGWQKRLLGFFAIFRPRPRAYLAVRTGAGRQSGES